MSRVRCREKTDQFPERNHHQEKTMIDGMYSDL